MRMRLFSSLTLAALLAGCTGDSDTTVQPVAVAAETPNAFLTYPNTQASLGAGTYRLMVTGTPGDTYQLTITRDDGSSQTYASRTLTGGTDTLPDITQRHAGGLSVVASAMSGNPLQLVLRRLQSTGADPLDAADDVLVTVATGTNGIDLPLTPISSAAYAQAYYDAVDPNGDRDTLEKWKLKNGFYDPANTVTHVIFRDALDLGYGRDMYVLKNPATGRIAFFVNNFVVALAPGSSANYGPLNVDAAISQDRRYLKGSNAIEFSPANEDNPADANGSMKITKFFTFDVNGNRLTSADLDGRGVKHMPGMCWACHGGQTLPLDASGKFQPYALRSAKFNILGVADFEYSLQQGFHRDQMEDKFRLINSYVHESYADLQARPLSGDTGRGKWSADYGLELVLGRYGGSFASGSYQDDFVPAGWQNGPGQENAELLFKRVVGPHCTACHSLQGRAATHEPTASPDAADNLGNAINFSSYGKFMAYRSRIIDYVYKRGIMPMSLRNFEAFWEHPDGAPAILAAALADPTLFDNNGRVIPPGKPVARPGANRTVRSPVQLDGSASSFATTYHWEVVSPTGTSAFLSDPAAARPVLSAPAGSYVLALTVSNARGSHTATVTYTVSAAASDQTGLTFADDIRPILASQTCTGCHSSSAASAVEGIPVYWSDEIEYEADGSATRLYQRVMARIDRKDPENSRLLQRPTSLMHGGGVVLNSAIPQDLSDYTTIVNWIREGAVCGVNPVGVDIGCPE